MLYVLPSNQSINWLAFASIHFRHLVASAHLVSNHCICCHPQSNGKRAVCPATVSVLINILSKWECNAELRHISLKCIAKMAIVLHRSSPVERQIELLTICQMYLGVIDTLLGTKQFLARPFDEKFDLAGNEDVYIDLNALSAAIDNVECILSESQSRASICYAMVEANFIPMLANVAKRVKQWEFDTQKLVASVANAIVLLSRTSDSVVSNLKCSRHIDTLFAGFRALGRPSRALVERCIELAYDVKKSEIVFGEVVIHMLGWIKDMHDVEQSYVAETLLKISTQNLAW